MPSNGFKVGLVGLNTTSGIDLGNAVQALCRERHLELEANFNANRFDFVRMVWDNDVLIFDGSIESPQQQNYHATAVIPSAVDHLLVVSRTYLPMNFIPARKGGAPDYPFPHRNTQLDPEPAAWSNADIIAWLRRQLHDLASHGPRSKICKFEELAQTKDAKEIAHIWARFYAEAAPKQSREGKVFISYRSKEYENVRKFSRTFSSNATIGRAPKAVTVIKPGVLAYERELLQPWRRWYLMALIDRIIDDHAMLIAYLSDDYFASWWTQGELITLAYRAAAGSSHTELLLFDPARRSLDKAPPGTLPAMSDTQQRRMARWYSHTDPFEMSPESISLMRSAHRYIGYVPKFLVGAAAKLIARGPIGQLSEGLFESLPDDKRGGKTAHDVWGDAGWMKQFFADPIWSDHFWDDFVVDCPCGKAGGHGLDVDMFLAMHPEHLVTVTATQVEEALRSGTLTCPRCGRVHRLIQAQPRYLWASLRGYQKRSEILTGLMALEPVRKITTLINALCIEEVLL